MKAKRKTALILVAAALGWAIAAPALASNPELARIGGIEPVQDRLELRSYEPYSTLQYGFRPEPPSPPRGVRKTRPEIVKPTRVAPLIRSGAPVPYTADWYRYCARSYRSFEPGTGLYTSYSGARRVCR
jgi:hypothetical protein